MSSVTLITSQIMFESAFIVVKQISKIISVLNVFLLQEWFRKQFFSHSNTAVHT